MLGRTSLRIGDGEVTYPTEGEGIVALRPPEVKRLLDMVEKVVVEVSR